MKKRILSVACMLGIFSVGGAFATVNNTPLTFTCGTTVVFPGQNLPAESCTVNLGIGNNNYTGSGSLPGPYVAVIQNNTLSLKQSFLTPTSNGPSISPTLQPITPSSYTSVPFRGVNLSGLEAGSTGGAYTQAYWNQSEPNTLDAQYFIAKGVNTVRIPINWGYLTPNADTSSVSALTANEQVYLQELTNTVQNMLQSGLNVVLDLHSYMRYGYDQSGSWAGNPVSASQLNAVWTLLASQLKTQAQQYNGVIHSNQLIFELMNEPHDMPTSDVLANSNAGIAAIRAQGLKNLILIDGNYWTGLHSWIQQDNSKVMTAANIIDSANNYALAVHEYFDQNGSGTNNTCQSLSSFKTYVNLAPFITWMQQNKMRVFMSEFGGSSSDPNCAQDIDWMLTQLEQNAYDPNKPAQGGFIGWTAWVAGHTWAMNDVNSIMPVNGVENANMVNAYSKHLTQAGSAVGVVQVGFGTIPQNFPTTASTEIDVNGQPANTACNIANGCLLSNIPVGTQTFSAKPLTVSFNNLTYIYTFTDVSKPVAKDGTVAVAFNLNNSQVLNNYTSKVTYVLNGVSPSDNTGLQVSFSGGTGVNPQSCTIPAGKNTAACNINYQSVADQNVAMQASVPTVAGYSTTTTGPLNFSVKDGSAATVTANYQKAQVYHVNVTAGIGGSSLTGQSATVTFTDQTTGKAYNQTIAVDDQAHTVDLPAADTYTVSASNFTANGNQYNVASVIPTSVTPSALQTPSVAVDYQKVTPVSGNCLVKVALNTPWQNPYGSANYSNTLNLEVHNLSGNDINAGWSLVVNGVYTSLVMNGNSPSAWNWSPTVTAQGTITGSATQGWETLQKNNQNSITVGAGVNATVTPTPAPGAPLNPGYFKPTSITLNGQACTIQ